MTLIPGFTGSPLQRLDRERYDADLFAALAGRADALLLELSDYVPTVEAGMLRWRPLDPLPLDQLALLGMLDGRPRFARIDPQAEGARRTPELMALLGELSAGEAETYAIARSLTDWHARHRFCANCGSATQVIRAGWARACQTCGTEHFPRTDPVAIMLAEHEGRVLVGRQAAFPPGRYSALAGFIEVGESIEEAVARELHEEAGVTATAVRYVASQPWPFPSQLMIACIARVADDAITLDQAELEDARWVDRDQVRAALAGEDGAAFLPPPPYAIAHTLFEAWLAEA